MEVNNSKQKNQVNLRLCLTHRPYKSPKRQWFMKARIDRGGIHRRMETEVGIFQDSNKKRRNGGFCLQRNHLLKRKQWGTCIFGGLKWLVWFDDQVGTEKSANRMEPQGRGPAVTFDTVWSVYRLGEYHLAKRLSRWLSGKESVFQCKRRGFNPWVRKIPWRRKWQPTPVFLPGQSHGLRGDW